MIYAHGFYQNGYGVDDEEYENLIDLVYGFEEYYYYNDKKYYPQYKKVIKLLNDARNGKLEKNYYHALLGWYILFKESIRGYGTGDYAISITDSCQLFCRHCYNQDNKRENRMMEYDKFVDIIMNHSKLSNMFPTKIKQFPHHIYILGGEPLLHPELDKFIRFMNSLNIGCYLETNAIAYRKEVAEALKDYENNRVIVSVDGLYDIHDTIRGKGSFEKSLKNIEKYKEDGFDVVINHVLNSYNYRELNDLINFFKNKYNIRVHYNKYVDKGDDVISMLNKEQCLYCNYKRLGRPCNMGEQVIYDVNGNSMPCGKSSLSPMCNYEDSLEEKFTKIKRFVLRTRGIPTYCQDCKKVARCRGGEMCTNFYKEKKHNLPDVICPMLNMKEQGEMYKIETPF